MYFLKCRIPQISTHTPLAGRDYDVNGQWSVATISTHTPLAGRDDERHHMGL